MSDLVFEDEMTEAHMAKTEEEYQRVTRQEIHCGHIDEMNALTNAIKSLATQQEQPK